MSRRLRRTRRASRSPERFEGASDRDTTLDASTSRRRSGARSARWLIAALVALTSSACPALFVAEVDAPRAIAPGQRFTLIARVALARAVVVPQEAAGSLAGRAHLAVRAPLGFRFEGALLVGDDEHPLTPAPMVAARYEAAHPAEQARWHAFVTRLYTDLRVDDTVRIRLVGTAPPELAPATPMQFGVGLAPDYPGWTRIPKRLRTLTLSATEPTAPKP